MHYRRHRMRLRHEQTHAMVHNIIKDMLSKVEDASVKALRIMDSAQKISQEVGHVRDAVLELKNAIRDVTTHRGNP